MLVQKLIKRMNNLKIKNKLIISLVILITAPLAILGFFSFNAASRIVNEKVDYNLKSSVKQITYNLDVILANMREMVEGVYQDKLTQKFLVNRSDIYTKQQYEDFIMTKLYRGNFATYLFTKDGRLYGYNISYTVENIDYKNTIEYKKCRENNDKLVWMPPNHISIGSKLFPEDTQDKISIAMIMKDFDSMNEAGFVEMVFKEEDIFNVYNKLEMTANSYGFVIDREGNIISHWNKSLLGKKEPFYSDIKNKAYENQNGSFVSKMSGKDCLIIYDTLNTTDWKLVYIVPANELVKDIVLIQKFFMVIIIICTITSIPIALFISRSISKPIENIIGVMTRFAEGDLSVRIRKYNDRTDEVGVLATEFNSMILQINSLIKNNYQNEIKKKEAEMEALQAQINPHFLYNTLDSINFIARKYKVYEISKMVIALGDLMRISIRKDRNIITVREEINYIENYMTIQKMRYKDRLSLQINVDESMYSYLMPKLILQPIIENAVVHGIEEKVGGGTICINGMEYEGDIIFEIIDDGVGLDEEAVNAVLKNNLLEYKNMSSHSPVLETEKAYSGKRGSNIGLLNVDMRLKIIYGGNYGVTIRSIINEGTVVTIRLPLKSI